MKRALTGPGLHARMKQIAILLQEQTIDRIEQGGDDEITFAPLDFPRPTGETDNPLFSTGIHLRDSITHGVDHDGPWVGSTFIGSAILQFGTKGKGGKLPTIVPKTAKALFIPLTTKAAKSVRVKEMAAGGDIKKLRKTPSRRDGRNVNVDLIKGEDFLLLQKVDIRPREYLRMSAKNLEEIIEVFEEGE